MVEKPLFKSCTFVYLENEKGSGISIDILHRISFVLLNLVVSMGV